MENRNKELQSIFKGIANKDENEFNKLYQNYKSLIYAVVFSMLKNKEDSEEVVQTVFEKIWNIKETNLPNNNETAWLYNVTKNETINYLRKQRDTINIDDLYYIDEENEELNNIINTEYYNKILSNLNTKDKEIVSLKILSNLSFKEISQILDIPIGTVQWKYYKSLHTLKMLMSNLTMFILTFALYIKQRSSIKKIAQKNEENMQESEKAQLQNSNKEDQQLSSEVEKEEIYQSSTTKYETKEQNSIEDNTSNQRGENIANDKIENNTEAENTFNETVESIEIKEKNIELQNNTLFYISSIFFVISIIFLAIWIKQKRHKTTQNNK